MAWTCSNFSREDAERMLGNFDNLGQYLLFGTIINEVINKQTCLVGVRKIHLTEIIAKLDNTIRSFVGSASSQIFADYLIGRAEEVQLKISKERIEQIAEELFKRLDEN